MDKKEELLAGGNVSEVYRVGNSIRRAMKPESSNIHRLLNHLEKRNITFTPRFLGIDEKGREILSFIDGEAGHTPLKAYMKSDKALSKIAIMLRQYHEALDDFEFDDSWKPLDLTPEPYETICHNDFALYNIIFESSRPVGIIDFDVAAPGPKMWDIAYCLYSCIPLSRFPFSEAGEKVKYEESIHASQIKHRVKLFFNSYGLEYREDYLCFVLARLEGLCQTIMNKAKEGDEAFQNMINEGHLEHYREEMKFINDNGAKWI